VAVQVITKDPIGYRNNTWVPGKSRKDLTERYSKQSDPSLSPPTSHRQKPDLPPLRTKAGTKPLAFEPTKTAAADLRRGLRMEVELVLESITGILMGLMALSSRRRALAVAQRLARLIFQLPVQRTGAAGAASSLMPSRRGIPPSNSQNLPRTGGGRQRMAARR
jgi:hypothetical protein